MRESHSWAELLLLSAEYDRFNFHFFIDIENAGSFRSMNLVTADRHEVDTNSFWMNAIFSESLHGIHMEQNSRIIILHNPNRLFDRLNGAHFIIHIHDRN